MLSILHSSARNQPQAEQASCTEPLEISSPEERVATPSASSDEDMEDCFPVEDNSSPRTHVTTSLPPPATADGRIEPKEKHAIRLVPWIDHNMTVPVRYVKTVERRLNRDAVIRLGRVESAHPHFRDVPPIVFKSKVVSRLHAEIFLERGQWYVRDVQSSSGTFLNNTRLSGPNKPSANVPLHNGDVLQLGLNFRGGTEEAFQCVKVRVQLDYSWQKRVSEYNIESHKKLRAQLHGDADAEDEYEECSICLGSLEPCQPLFISPCSHGWHYKCIRPVLIRCYPHFHCPNCRSTFDLEEDDE